jgi:superfamily II DNA/RNA helicase
MLTECSLAQSQRESTIRKFKEGKEVTVVIATDVAARGLDIKGIGKPLL